MTCAFDGNDLKILYDSGGMYQPTGLAVNGDLLYFADPAHEAIYVGSTKSTSTAADWKFEQYTSGIDKLVTLKIFKARYLGEGTYVIYVIGAYSFLQMCHPQRIHVLIIMAAVIKSAFMHNYHSTHACAVQVL